MNAMQLEKRINYYKTRMHEVQSIMDDFFSELPDKLFFALSDRRSEYENKIENMTIEKIAAQKKEGKAIHFTIDRRIGLDSGNCRLYLRDPKKTLYCIQVGIRNRLELNICTKDGEPSYEIRDFYIIHNGQYCLDYYDIANNENFIGGKAATKVYKALTEYN